MKIVKGHRRDIGGVFFIALGLLSALGVYVDAAGPLGNGLTQFFGGVVGLVRMILPVVFVAVTVAMLSDGYEVGYYYLILSIVTLVGLVIPGRRFMTSAGRS
jgi:hypothetical protein